MQMARALRCLAEDGGLDRVEWAGSDGRVVSATDAGLLTGDLTFSDITFDSRACEAGSLFVCKGARFKEDFLREAVLRGACAYLAERAYPECGVAGIVVSDVRRSMGLLALEHFGHPSRSLDVVGVTGTKGKTTVTFYMDAILRSRGEGFRSGLIGGLYNDVGDGPVPSHNTTPESVELQRLLRRAVDRGCDIVAMEVSSQGLKYDRTLGTDFAVGAFTNIGEDHISPIEHPDFDDYFASKLALFASTRNAVVNLDAQRSDEILAAAGGCGRVVTYSTETSSADVRLLDLSPMAGGGWDLSVELPSGPLRCKLGALGRFNVSNAMAALAACDVLGVERDAMADGLAEVRVPGRMERYASPDGSVVGVVDYAHNEMSLAALLESVRRESDGRTLAVVFGSTGMKAQDRRAGLGRAALLADRVILTEDEPGRVPVAEICDEIAAALRAAGRPYEVVEDRIEAVRLAVETTPRPCVIVLAGKGAEDTMLRGDVDEPYPTDAAVLCGLLGIEFEGYAYRQGIGER